MIAEGQESSARVSFSREPTGEETSMSSPMPQRAKSKKVVKARPRKVPASPVVVDLQIVKSSAGYRNAVLAVNEGKPALATGLSDQEFAKLITG